jgi:hypothetical protein
MVCPPSHGCQGDPILQAATVINATGVTAEGLQSGPLRPRTIITNRGSRGGDGMFGYKPKRDRIREASESEHPPWPNTVAP